MSAPDTVCLTEGNIPRQMLRFAAPILLSDLFQQLYNTVDSLIVGNIAGQRALAAVASSGSLIMLLVGFAHGLAMGAGVVVARCYGAGEDAALERAVHTIVAVGLAFGAFLTVFGVAFTPHILRWMGTPADVLPNSIAYFRVYSAGVSAVVLYNMAAAILQAVGDSRSPMRYLICASLLNVALDLLFVGALRRGVAGAALATVLSQAFSAVLAFRKLCRAPAAWRLRPRRIRFDWRMLRRVVGQGVPAGLQVSVTSLANVVVQSNINTFGAAAMAGCGAYSKIEGFAFLPVTCFSLALATFVSQNLGAGKPDRVRAGMRFGVLCSALLAEGVGLVLYLFAPACIRAFNGEPEILPYGVGALHTIVLFYGLLAFSHCCAGILRGLGKPLVPMLIMIGVWCVLRVSYITVLLALWHDIHIIWSAYPVTWAVSGVLFVLDLAHTLRRLPAAAPPQT